jgi:hypothetical protein
MSESLIATTGTQEITMHAEYVNGLGTAMAEEMSSAPDRSVEVPDAPH